MYIIYILFNIYIDINFLLFSKNNGLDWTESKFLIINLSSIFIIMDD